MAATAQDLDLAHAQRERFCFIESSLLWEGAIRRQRVSQVFNVSLNHVTKDLRRYEAAFPDNITFDHHRRLYVPTPKFKPRFASRDPGEYLALQLAHAQSDSAVVVPLLGGWEAVPTYAIPSPPHGIHQTVLRTIVRAITSKTAADVLYHSTRAAEPGKRRLWPHALVHTGVRWHARAYDGERQAFRNFALQRMESPQAVSAPCPVRVEQDADWRTTVRLRVVPHPDLNAHQRRLVARDFGMTEGAGGLAWDVTLRRCLVGYFAQQYDLDRKAAPGVKPRILLANEADVRQWFLSAKS